MKDLPTRDPRTPEEQAADAEAMQAYMRSDETQKPLRHILEKGEWQAVVPGHPDYIIALPNRYDIQTGMSISPSDPGYESAAKKRPRRFR